MTAISKTFLIGIGAFVGANLRYWLGGWIQDRLGHQIPWGTGLVNVSGSLAIGIAMAMLAHAESPSFARLLVVTGLLGGFTTFSAFSYELTSLLNHGAFGRAAVYFVGTNALCIASCWIGFVATRWAMSQ